MCPSGLTAQALHRALPGHLHNADSISEVHLAPHANGDLSPNGAGARAGEARSWPAVVINSGSGGLCAHQGWDVPSLRAHMCGQSVSLLCAGILQDHTTFSAQGYSDNVMPVLAVTRDRKTADRLTPEPRR